MVHGAVSPHSGGFQGVREIGISRMAIPGLYPMWAAGMPARRASTRARPRRGLDAYGRPPGAVSRPRLERRARSRRLGRLGAGEKSLSRVRLYRNDTPVGGPSPGHLEAAGGQGTSAPDGRGGHRSGFAGTRATHLAPPPPHPADRPRSVHANRVAEIEADRDDVVGEGIRALVLEREAVRRADAHPRGERVGRSSAQAIDGRVGSRPPSRSRDSAYPSERRWTYLQSAYHEYVGYIWYALLGRV